MEYKLLVNVSGMIILDETRVILSANKEEISIREGHLVDKNDSVRIIKSMERLLILRVGKRMTSNALSKPNITSHITRAVCTLFETKKCVLWPATFSR